MELRIHGEKITRLEPHGFYVDSPGGTTLHIDEVRVTKQ